MTSIRTIMYVGVFLIYTPALICASPQANWTLSKVVELIENLRKDERNNSFSLMINNTVMKEHTLTSHKEDQPYFYTDKRYNISEILSMILERPEGVIDETATTGLLKIYRTFNFQSDIRILFVKEKKSLSSFPNAYLGETPEGPTNQAMLIIKVSDPQNNTRESNSIASFYPILQFIDAYPIKLK